MRCDDVGCDDAMRTLYLLLITLHVDRSTDYSCDYCTKSTRVNVQEVGRRTLNSLLPLTSSCITVAYGPSDLLI